MWHVVCGMWHVRCGVWSVVQQPRHYCGAIFSRRFKLNTTPPRAPSVLGAHAGPVLIGAGRPMVCPIRVFRALGGRSDPGVGGRDLEPVRPQCERRAGVRSLRHCSLCIIFGGRFSCMFRPPHTRGILVFVYSYHVLIGARDPMLCPVDSPLFRSLLLNSWAVRPTSSTYF